MLYGTNLSVNQNFNIDKIKSEIYLDILFKAIFVDNKTAIKDNDEILNKAFNLGSFVKVGLKKSIFDISAKLGYDHNMVLDDEKNSMGLLNLELNVGVNPKINITKGIDMTFKNSVILKYTPIIYDNLSSQDLSTKKYTDVLLVFICNTN